MSMWKVVVAPEEDGQAWGKFLKQGIIAIGWCDRKMDNELPVRQFRKICQGDWILAHLPTERSGVSFLAVGLGRIISDYHEMEPDPSDGWNGSFRRQYRVEWVSTIQKRMPDIMRQCNYRTTVCRMRCELEAEVLRRFSIQD